MAGQAYPGETHPLGTGSYEMGLGDAGENQDELNQLHGEFAEVGSPADEEATKLRTADLMKEMDAETDLAIKLEMLQKFVLEERTKAAEVATRLVEKRKMLPTEETK